MATRSRRSRPGGQEGSDGGEINVGAGVGAWLPWEVVLAACRLGLRPPSAWQVFLAVLATWARYGRTEARLTAKALARMTGLSERTVKAAVAQLLARGVLVRRGRYGRLAVALGAGQGAANEGGAGGANKLAPPRGSQACPSPTSIHCPLINNDEVVSEDCRTFTPKQRGVIVEVLAEATELLGADAADLPLPDAEAGDLGLPAGTTFRQAWHAVRAGGDRGKAGRFVRAVLGLRHDPRVQGYEVRLGP